MEFSDGANGQKQFNNNVFFDADIHECIWSLDQIVLSNVLLSLAAVCYREITDH